MLGKRAGLTVIAISSLRYSRATEFAEAREHVERAQRTFDSMVPPPQILS